MSFTQTALATLNNKNWHNKYLFFLYSRITSFNRFKYACTQHLSLSCGSTTAVVINIKSPSPSLYRWMYNNDTCIIICRHTNDYNCKNKRGMICWGTPCLYSRPLMNDPKNSWAFLPERPRIISGVNTLSITLSSYKSWLPFPYRQDKTLYFL